MKKTWNIKIFVFCMICNFFKYDDFTVLWIISIIYYGINFIASSLQPWPFDNKTKSEKIATLMKGGLL